MTDVRALLKAKRTERGIITKPSTSTGRAARERPNTFSQPKRRLDNEQTEEIAIVTSDAHNGKRRKVENVSPIRQPDLPTFPPAPSGFPADFFSDPSRAPQLGGDSDNDDNNSSPVQGTSSHSNTLVTSYPPSTSAQITIDAELEVFEKAIASASKPAPQPPDQAIFSRATVYAEPKLVEEVPEGFPESVLDRESRNHTGPTPGSSAGREQGTPVTIEESVAEKQKRREQDERELIMDRLLDEERAQEEADARVNALKARMEAIRQKREAIRAQKQKQKQAG
ncbi:uncharacterized protein EI90DRAFT_3117610 [Cantharellus anzutake]|uniref:uncharacterized protein n=1 Tax=Cantharellus anzutake TaxID=1750568 RepID=UPI00190319B9|nr:uncharacterized protein EI90DRAFT_3117610 [Cantharellus anzutake]KAF8339858.1 hypothetical protein EI90DRAFT_3117610 [Cantharellus anzutake]